MLCRMPLLWGCEKETLHSLHKRMIQMIHWPDIETVDSASPQGAVKGAGGGQFRGSTVKEYGQE